MPGVSRRAGKNGKYRIWYKDEAGRRKFATGYTDKRSSQKLADDLEEQARRVREGLVDPRHKTQQAAAGVSVDYLIGVWQASIEARGKSPKHARHQARDARRVLEAAGVASVKHLDTDRITAAVAALTHRGKPASARTRNHALAAVKAFVRWLDATGRIREYPRAWRVRADKANEAADRRYRRRALTPEEFARLVEATEAGPTVETVRGPRAAKKGERQSRHLTGPDRAMVYRVAAGTGFRANELRSLTPKSFDLEGDDPAVTVTAAYSKRKREDRQPIRRELAALLRPYLAGRDPDAPVWAVPEKTAKMLRGDFARAGIPYEVEGRVADFHALRAAYVTGLVRSGVDAATAQKLARHSDVRLTLTVYTDTTKGELRKALEGETNEGRS